jgi:hypothetical protein
MKRKHKYDILVDDVKKLSVPREVVRLFRPVLTSYTQDYFRSYIRIGRMGLNGAYFRILARYGGRDRRTIVTELVSMSGQIYDDPSSYLYIDGGVLNVVSVDEFMSALTVLG